MATVNLGPGDDTWGLVEDNSGPDLVSGEDGNDFIYGGHGADELRGGAGNDRLYGRQDDDLLSGGDGDDELNGGQGADTLNGGAGHDQLRGGRGDDHLNGGIGNDRLWGDDGVDVLDGGAGADLIVGGRDNDTLTGGGGDDTFVFNYRFDGPTAMNFTAWAQAEMGVTVDDGIRQDQFYSAYSAWLGYVAETLGIGSDVDGNGRVDVMNNQTLADGTPGIEGVSDDELAAIFGNRASISVETDTSTRTRYYSDTASMPGELVGSDGADVILDFSAGDTIELRGITEDQAMAMFSIESTGNVAGDPDQVDTVISWEGGQIVLADHDIDDLSTLIDNGWLMFA